MLYLHDVEWNIFCHFWFSKLIRALNVRWEEKKKRTIIAFCRSVIKSTLDSFNDVNDCTWCVSNYIINFVNNWNRSRDLPWTLTKGLNFFCFSQPHSSSHQSSTTTTKMFTFFHYREKSNHKLNNVRGTLWKFTNFLLCFPTRWITESTLTYM